MTGLFSALAQVANDFGGPALQSQARMARPVARLVQQDGGLRAMTMALCALILVAGFVAILVSVWRHHARGAAQRSNFHGLVATEVSWALVPCLMVAVLVWPVVRGVITL